jgi:hypothetical protein
MFAASPGLHGIEHPVYDIWLVDCKGGTEVIAEPKEAAEELPPVEEAPRQTRGGASRPGDIMAPEPAARPVRRPPPVETAPLQAPGRRAAPEVPPINTDR